MRIRLSLFATWVGLGSVAVAAAQTPLRPAAPVAFVDLAYPREALDARTIGFVVVRATTDAEGRVTGAESLTGPDVLARATVDNVRQWTLSTRGGSEVLVFRFDIDYARCNDDSRSLFRLVHPDLAVIAACSGPTRKPVSTRDWWLLRPQAPPPQYPGIAHRARVAGVVALDVSIDAEGRVVDVKALSQGTPLLAPAAVADVKTWRAMANPRPPGRNVVIVYEFAFDGRRCDSQYSTSYEDVLPQYVRLSGCSPVIDHSTQ
jgi:TonB family protein